MFSGKQLGSAPVAALPLPLPLREAAVANYDGSEAKHESSYIPGPSKKKGNKVKQHDQKSKKRHTKYMNKTCQTTMK